MRIGIVGATGAVGREVLSAMSEQTGEVEGLEAPLLFATAQSAGEELPWLEDEDVEVEPYAAASLQGLDAAIVAVPAAAAPPIVQALREKGIPAVDVSRAHREIAPMTFAGPIAAPGGIVALPGTEALLLARLLAPLRSLKPTWVRATLLRPASAAGQLGVRELAESTGRLLNGQEPEGAPQLGHRLAFNLIPQAGAFAGATSEAESDLANELSRLYGEKLPVSSTIAMAPWFYGHAAFVSVGLGERSGADAVRSALAGATDVKVVDAPAEQVYPMPSLATGDDAVLVGRIRADETAPDAVQLVAVLDGVRAAAVLAVHTAIALARGRAAH